jgi:hypothetical protein
MTWQLLSCSDAAGYRCCQHAAAEWAFSHCKQHYAPSNAAGWLGIWDVDEFVFPCMRPSTPQRLQDSNLLWSAYAASTKAGADGHESRCSLFGQNLNNNNNNNQSL